MRRKIINAFSLLFALFIAGSGITVYSLVRITGELRHLIGLHEIEDIRQDLSSGIQKVTFYVFAPPEILSEQMDEIIRNTNTMHDAIRRCNECHHEPEVHKELLAALNQADQFEKRLRHLITVENNGDRRKTQQEELYLISTDILNRVQAMVTRAAMTIDKRTIAATKKMDRVYLLVGSSLVITIVITLLIARLLIQSITGPIGKLVSSTRRIADGQWGYQIDLRTTGEFQKLVDSFNQMSESLAIKREQEQLHLQRLKETQKQLIEAEKLSALGTMAGGIAHDFNNILCGMIGHLSILSRQIPRNEAHLKTIATIEKAGFRAADLVKQLLTFARQKPMEHQAVCINKCVRDVMLLLGNTLDKRIKVKLDLDDTLSSIMGDGAQLEQVVLNLCVNARDAMPEGGELSLRTEVFEPDEFFRVRHRDAEQREYILLTVRDTGCGINEKILPRIFDPFFTTKEVGKGTGLGLAMVYGIVQNHEGICTIESKPGRGTTVKVYIPSSGSMVTEHEAIHSSIFPPGKTIMIVDDEAMVVEMLKNHLEGLGCRILTAENGQEAVVMLEEHADEIDLIILDINMPVMCGRDAYHQFIRIKPDIKVLVSSGYIMNEETREVLDMGAQGFLQKPYRMEDISARIVEILGQENVGD